MTYFWKNSDTSGSFVMIMDRADGNLERHLSGTDIRPRRALVWMFDQAVAYIHGLGIRHRNIKPSNVLVKGNEVLLAGFSLSRMGFGEIIPMTAPFEARTRTPTYCAPK